MPPTEKVPQKKIVFVGFPPYGTEFTEEHILEPKDLAALGFPEKDKPMSFKREQGFIVLVDASEVDFLSAMSKQTGFKVKDA